MKGPDLVPVRIACPGQMVNYSMFSYHSLLRTMTPLCFMTRTEASTHDPREGDSVIYPLGGFIKARFASANSVS